METWDGQISGRYFQIFSYDADYYRMLKEWASSEQYEREAATFLQLLKLGAGEKMAEKEYGNVSPIGTTKELYAVIAQKIARDGEE